MRMMWISDRDLRDTRTELEQVKAGRFVTLESMLARHRLRGMAWQPRRRFSACPF